MPVGMKDAQLLAAVSAKAAGSRAKAHPGAYESTGLKAGASTLLPELLRFLQHGGGGFVLIDGVLQFVKIAQLVDSNVRFLHHVLA